MENSEIQMRYGMFFIVLLWINGMFIGISGYQLIFSTRPDEDIVWYFMANLVAGLLMLIGFAIEIKKIRIATAKKQEAK